MCWYMIWFPSWIGYCHSRYSSRSLDLNAQWKSCNPHNAAVVVAGTVAVVNSKDRCFAGDKPCSRSRGNDQRLP